MIVIDSEEKLIACLPSGVQNLMMIRRDLIDLATFIIVQPGDDISTVEDVIGFPLLGDHPPWEWVLNHQGVFEAPIITSDDGSGIVLIVPDLIEIDARLLSRLNDQAEVA